MVEILRFRKNLKIVHHVPGRIRLRFFMSPNAKISFDKSSDPLELISDWLGIEDIRLNLRAGSIVIQYNINQISPQNWVELIQGTDAQAQEILTLFSQDVALRRNCVN